MPMLATTRYPVPEIYRITLMAARPTWASTGARCDRQSSGRIMLAVTEVNGCELCSFGPHAARPRRGREPGRGPSPARRGHRGHSGSPTRWDRLRPALRRHPRTPRPGHVDRPGQQLRADAGPLRAARDADDDVGQRAGDPAELAARTAAGDAGPEQHPHLCDRDAAGCGDGHAGRSGPRAAARPMGGRRSGRDRRAVEGQSAVSLCASWAARSE